MTSKSFYFRSNVPESTLRRPPKNHNVLQEKVDAEESTEHQETSVDTTKKPHTTNSVAKENKAISGKTAMTT